MDDNNYDFLFLNHFFIYETQLETQLFISVSVRSESTKYPSSLIISSYSFLI